MKKEIKRVLEKLAGEASEFRNYYASWQKRQAEEFCC